MGLRVTHRSVKQCDEVLYADEWNDVHSVEVVDDVDFSGKRIRNVGAPATDMDVPRARAEDILSGVFSLERIPSIDWTRISDNFPRVIGDLVSSPFSRGWISDFFNPPFWGSIPDKPSVFPPEPHLHDAVDVASGRLSLSRLPTSPSAGRFLVVREGGGDPVYDVLRESDIPGLDASKIVSGRFPMGRMPSGVSGCFLKAQGVGVDPVYAPITVSDISDYGQLLDDIRVIVREELEEATSCVKIEGSAVFLTTDTYPKTVTIVDTDGLNAVHFVEGYVDLSQLSTDELITVTLRVKLDAEGDYHATSEKTYGGVQALPALHVLKTLGYYGLRMQLTMPSPPSSDRTFKYLMFRCRVP